MAKNVGLHAASNEDTLKKLALVGVIVVAVVAMRIGCSSASQDSALKTAPIQTPELQKQQTEKDVQAIQNNPNMSEQAKEISINMIKSHSSISGAVPMFPPRGQ